MNRWTQKDLQSLSKRSRCPQSHDGGLQCAAAMRQDQWFLAVDPHLRHMDCAIIEWGNEAVLDVFTIPSDKVKKREELISYWAAQASGQAIKIGSRLKMCVIEVPDYINPKSGNKGLQSLVSVTLAAGGFALAMSMQGVVPVFVQPREWKGSKKKAETDSYVKILAEAKLIPQKTNQHQRDAIWMGLSWLKQQKEKSLPSRRAV